MEGGRMEGRKERKNRKTEGESKGRELLVLPGEI